MITANPIYRNPEACHGPCYVLDPFAYELGERVVIKTIPAKNPRVKKPRKSPEKQLVTPKEMRRVVVWPPGRAYDFKLVYVPVWPPEPVWAVRARELKAFGWSRRRIMKELDIKSTRQVVEILYK